MLGLKLNYVSKRGHCWNDTSDWKDLKYVHIIVNSLAPGRS